MKWFLIFVAYTSAPLEYTPQVISPPLDTVTECSDLMTSATQALREMGPPPSMPDAVGFIISCDASIDGATPEYPVGMAQTTGL